MTPPLTNLEAHPGKGRALSNTLERATEWWQQGLCRRDHCREPQLWPVWLPDTGNPWQSLSDMEKGVEEGVGAVVYEMTELMQAA